MVQVKSLKRTIIVQFAVILIPLTGFLTFQATRNAQRSAAPSSTSSSNASN